MKIENLFEILLQNNASEIIRNNEKYIFKIIPELEKCKNFNQNNPWHIYDVYEHILHVIDKVPNILIIRLAALFHDIGKPYVYQEDENKIGHFNNHWIKSKEIFNSFAEKNNIDNNIKILVEKLIYYHDINIDKINNEELEKILNTFNPEEIIMLFQLKKADLLSQNEKFHYLLDTYKKQELQLLKKLNNK